MLMPPGQFEIGFEGLDNLLDAGSSRRSASSPMSMRTRIVRTDFVGTSMPLSVRVWSARIVSRTTYDWPSGNWY